VVVGQPQNAIDGFLEIVHSGPMRSPEGIERRKQQQRDAAELKRRSAGVAPRTKLSEEEERERSRLYSAARKQNPEKRKQDNATTRKRLREKRKDPFFRMIASMRSRISKEISGGFQKPDSTIKALGCSFGFFKTWIESKFLPGMSWENYGRHGWHLDHVREVCTFEISDPEQFSACCHYTNLQPLWADQNLKKEHKRRAVARGEP
jgi:hypothetical protein